MPRGKHRRGSLPAPESPAEVYSAGLYGRLSVLDNGKADCDSLESQIELMERYVAERPYLKRFKVYQDNGYTGTTFDRPGWDTMMQDVRSGKVNCIVVKDLSRLGRNYIEVGLFLEKECPALGIRFISITDGFDSSAYDSNEALAVALKNIVNDYYAKDISRKTCSALEIKRKQGEYIGNYAPYGYRKDPANKNHLMIDPVAAPWVRLIYEWRAEGESYASIIRKLTARDIPSPGRYQFENGIYTNTNKKGSKLLWGRHMLKIVLENPAYIGTLEQGKCRATLYQGIPEHTVGKEEWDIVAGTHDPIIPLDLFQKVQAVNQSVKAERKATQGKYDYLPKETNPYGKKLVCSDCGRPLKLYRSIARGGKACYYSYLCPTFEERGVPYCTKKSIRTATLDEAVLTATRAQMDLFLHTADILSKLGSRKGASHASQKRELEKLISRKQALLTESYGDWKSGLMTKDEYLYAKERYTVEVEQLRQELSEMTDSTADALVDAGSWAQLIRQFTAMGHVTKEMADALIDSITLNDQGNITITFRFNDAKKLIDAEISRLKKEAA